MCQKKILRPLVVLTNSHKISNPTKAGGTTFGSLEEEEEEEED